LAVAIGVMGFSSPTEAPYFLAAIALLVVFLSASQDIVIDAYRVDTIPPSERGVAAAATAFGFRTASVLASTVLVLIAAHTSWHTAFLVVAVLMAATMLTTFWAPEPLASGQPPKTLADAVWHPLRNLVSQKGAWGFLLLVLLYKAGDAFALSLYSAFMIKGVGFSLDELSIAGKANMTVSTIVGVTLGGLIYMRWGMFRSLLIFGIGQSVTNLLYTVLALSGRKVWLMALATTVDTGVGGMGQAAFVGFIMSLCDPNFSATQYALLSAMASIPRVTTGAIAGTLVSYIGWPKFFVVTCLTAVPGLVLLVILRRPLNELAARDATKSKA
jgi:MFS transporter, PAT family, beta-lactamase induction signal transducer AmpG